ncbi:MAG TPA: DUF2851 family protein [Candidatus Paceibacterota bacterium]|nr:DUF2851 family protein [Verrucomicrobiota bacterium]HRZ45379.1 DUF2851 family protein [Candidatus Paceibacterota bacterium]
MNRSWPEFYRRWRREGLEAGACREAGGSPAPPPERLLQAVWRHQRLLRDRLRTLDGRRLRILHPGFHNVEAGPDFQGAVVQFEGEPARAGDVEVDVAASGWEGHGHHTNPAYGRVILHVVWEPAAAAGPGRPTMALCESLDAPLEELEEWLGSEAARRWPEECRGRCFDALGGMAAEGRRELIRQAARVRFEGKAREVRARARQVGWDAALAETMFRVLGYKHNAWPMQRLAELVGWGAFEGGVAEAMGEPVLGWQARLLGLAGMLPEELSAVPAGSRRYVRRLWDVWWRERSGWLEAILPSACWHRHGQRPANHPHRRLALAAHWLARPGLPGEIEAWFVLGQPAAEAIPALGHLLQAGPDEFWDVRCTLRSRGRGEPQPLLGGARLSGLAVNAILPWLWARADAGRNEALRGRAEALYAAWPKGEDNRVLGLARDRLLGPSSGRELRTAADQQGLLQIVRDFCDRSNAICAGCDFPARLRELESRG